MEIGDSHLQPLEPCRPRQFTTIANTSRQSVFAYKDAARRALAS